MLMQPHTGEGPALNCSSVLQPEQHTDFPHLSVMELYTSMAFAAEVLRPYAFPFQRIRKHLREDSIKAQGSLVFFSRQTLTQFWVNITVFPSEAGTEWQYSVPSVNSLVSWAFNRKNSTNAGWVNKWENQWANNSVSFASSQLRCRCPRDTFPKSPRPG